uniref:Haloacid dehalogenase-like hydrolase domain-containing protein 2 n=1 Tax=Gadus morhua TaxID=8049 RepID=A0A8C5F822_GADMO
MSGRRALRAVLVDLSGTLHIEDTATPVRSSWSGSARPRWAVRFVMSTMEIFTSLSAARRLVEQNHQRPLLLVEDSALEDFAGLDTSNPNAVVVGLAPQHFNYQTLNTAFRLVLEGAPLVAVHKARYYQRGDGLALGPGPFVTALEYASGRSAVVVGKPQETFFTQVPDSGMQPGEAVMIGDDARDDVGGAQNAGMRGILVRTGKYRVGDESKISPGPYLTCDSFPDAVDHLLKDLL